MSDLFDQDALLERVDGDLEFLAETVEMLADDSRELLEQARAAAAAGDAPGLVKSVHALKGMVGNFCATPAEEVAREVEAMGREGRVDGALAAVERLRVEVERLRAALEAFLSELGA